MRRGLTKDEIFGIGEDIGSEENGNAVGIATPHVSDLALSGAGGFMHITRPIKMNST